MDRETARRENEWHTHTIRVRYAETDQMGVVYHARYLDWFEIGRTEMIRSKGMDYRTLEEKGLLLPVLEVNVKYLKSAKYDDLVDIRTALTHYTSVRMEFAYELRLSGTEMRIAEGKTTHMWVNRQWRPARLEKEAPELWALLQEGSQGDA